ncbi:MULTISPECIES: orotate phosphoribosyltransferase [Hahella]|uniref:Orotate phosphoribosyltransferase n=1 Tax=Hahella chejuensis (strain KCTC 2396) TaxID=349521 RepID=PYRE_HAHCH|nr:MULTISPECIES: orotate phosphoribosyltransferase [Hahella]Q2S8N8.1 RecName: Full=Orotate phosphoribosyltransferase; Short=OPRT; Short=OPRTase [Hahella chejuensis KCTC 2396]ABC32986.1 Orotate phosphoribosyltransferase [Hahella chejuensis KCTC 2396]AZZ94790.1 orotate phosphoribosyltransferase [Hahella sp. KA22]MBU6952667.1 orotate phosphoribosyltransferase [Hahella sp. HN01]MDG9667118.1 orotate phosphoribosyltransferase [Hahella sp. CR1]QAY58164.1 orotate phosphoribosyltransferase [Hahella sp
MHDYQKAFIEFAIQREVLKFGQFTLKSGRSSPYFFNAGLFNTSTTLAQIGHFYAAALTSSPLQYDMLFGPAYKGIPLVSALAVTLANEKSMDVPYAFNRKEAKAHGEGGVIVGAPLKGKVLIVDDVITAGTAIREVISIIKANGAEPAGVLIALDRQERGQHQLSAIQEIEQNYQIPVTAIIQLDQILEFLKSDPHFSDNYKQVAEYRAVYGVQS